MLKKPATKEEIEAQKIVNNTIFIPSRFKFLTAHNGVRPRTLHGLISNTGAGKSTLIKSIIAEVAKYKKILIWISEESVAEYQVLINQLSEEILENITFVEERSIPEHVKENQKAFFNYFVEMVTASGARMVFIDNITTSVFYNSRFGFFGQTKTCEFLLNFVKKVCSVFYVAHTGKHVTDNYNKIVTPEDMRNSSELPMQTEYLYIIQKFTSEGKIFNILRNAKHRHHDSAAGYFSLAYEKGCYVGDGRIDAEMVNYIFQLRDYLGKKIHVPKPDKPLPKETEEPKETSEVLL